MHNANSDSKIIRLEIGCFPAYFAGYKTELFRNYYIPVTVGGKSLFETSGKSEYYILDVVRSINKYSIWYITNHA